MYKTADMIEDLPKLWRILAVLIPFQMFGSIIGLVIGFHHSCFENLWVGGAVATPIGFVIGLVWHIKANPSQKPNRTIIFFGILVLFISGAAILSDIPRSIKEMNHLELFQKMSSKFVTQIVVYDEYGKKMLKKISDPNALTEFKSACEYSKGNRPNHPNYATSWYVKIFADEIIEIECHFQEGKPSLLIGYFVKKVGPSTSYYGSFYNKELRSWFEKYVIDR